MTDHNRATEATERDPHRNPWRESLENCIDGSNYLRASEYRALIDDIDLLIDQRDDAVRALIDVRSQPAADPVADHNLRARLIRLASSFARREQISTLYSVMPDCHGPRLSTRAVRRAVDAADEALRLAAIELRDIADSARMGRPGQPAAAVAVPAGWRAYRETDGEIVLVAPDGSSVMVEAEERRERILPGIMLHRLLDAMLAVSAAAPSEAQAVDAVPHDHERFDAIAQQRYRVEPTTSGYWGWQVLVGDGTAQMYKGHKSDCELVARRMAGAFLDGAFMAADDAWQAGWRTGYAIGRGQASREPVAVDAVPPRIWRTHIQPLRLAAQDLLDAVNHNHDTKPPPAKYTCPWGAVARLQQALDVTPGVDAVQAGAMTAAARDVLAERRRQVSVEGWTAEHDDEHLAGSMSKAAASYVVFGDMPLYHEAGRPPAWWPWEASWWKPKDTRSNLVRAGALVLAEIERLDRRTSAGGTGEAT